MTKTASEEYFVKILLYILTNLDPISIDLSKNTRYKIFKKLFRCGCCHKTVTEAEFNTSIVQNDYCHDQMTETPASNKYSSEI